MYSKINLEGRDNPSPTMNRAYNYLWILGPHMVNGVHF